MALLLHLPEGLHLFVHFTLPPLSKLITQIIDPLGVIVRIGCEGIVDENHRIGAAFHHKVVHRFLVVAVIDDITPSKLANS